MTEDSVQSLEQRALVHLPKGFDVKTLKPFSAVPGRISASYEFDRLLEGIYAEEAKRLGLSPERYEYSCICEMYKPKNKIFETHYLIYNPGSAIMRGILGNVLGSKLRKKQRIDLGKLFEEIAFSFEEVLYILPGVDVGGYGNFHAFFNILNKTLKNHNLVVAYMRYDDGLAWRHGFDDHVGLIEGIPGKGTAQVILGEVEMSPIQEIKERELYAVDVKGGKLVSAPIASCNWNLNSIEGMKRADFLKASPDDVPVKDRQVETFHFLNGVTPYYMKTQLRRGFEEIRNFFPLEDRE